MSDITITTATPADHDAIIDIFLAVVQKGDCFPYDPDSSREDARAIWLSEALHTIYVARLDGDIKGTYRIRENRPGLGSHVANAGFMVHPDEVGKGVGKAMAAHCLQETKRLGFKAIQYNYVVSTNTRSISLWESLGFTIIGTAPKAFNHKEKGLVDVYMMHKML